MVDIRALDTKASPVADALTERMLPLLQVLALVSLLFVVVEIWQAAADAPDGQRTVMRVLAVVAVTVWALILVSWVVRRRTRSRRLRGALSTIVLTLALPLPLYGTLGLVYPVLLLALALVVIDVSPRAGVVSWAAMVTLPQVLVILSSTSRPWEAAVSVVGLGASEGLGLALGLLWRGFAERREADERTLAERDAALTQLESAMVRLRRAADTEKELVLADERARAAHELHDGLGHRLTLISISLELAERMRERDPRVAWQEVASARSTSVTAMEEMRTWVRALSPVRQSDLTGVAALDVIAESFRGTGLDVQVTSRDDDPEARHRVELDEDVSLLLYRAVQEGLTNALRHGRARHVVIEVGTGSGAVSLVLRSDLGAAEQQTLPQGPLTPGFGLRGLADRAAAVGGSASARRDGEEVILSVSVPAHRGERPGVPA